MLGLATYSSSSDDDDIDQADIDQEKKTNEQKQDLDASAKKRTGVGLPSASGLLSTPVAVAFLSKPAAPEVVAPLNRENDRIKAKAGLAKAALLNVVVTCSVKIIW